MISPAERFAARCKERNWHWNDTVSTEQFQEAITAAMLEMQLRNSVPPDMASAAAYQWRSEGAKQFVAILFSLLIKPEPRKVTDSENLNWKA